VVAEVREKEGRWYFVNVHYPGKHDLLAILAALKARRGRHLPTLAGQGLGAGGWPAIVQARRMSWAVC